MPFVNILVYGLGDALNPCNLATMVMFAALLGWLRDRYLFGVSLGCIFIGVSYAASLIYLAGGLMNILYSILFFDVMRVFYCVIGVVFLLIGFLHLVDWARIQKGDLTRILLPFSSDGKGQQLSKVLGTTSVVVLAIILNATATIWPANKSIMFYANYLFVPGVFLSTLFMLATYSLMLTLPLTAALFWIRWTSPSGWVFKNLSKTKIILSSFLLGLGGSLVYIFH